MERKSFSIDALLAKEPKKEGLQGQKSPALRSPGTESPGSPHGSFSPGSARDSASAGPSGASPPLTSPIGMPRHGSPGDRLDRPSGSSPAGPGGPHGMGLPPRGSFIPRPGLLNVQHPNHPAMAGLASPGGPAVSHALAAAGLFPGYNYPAHPGQMHGHSAHQAAALQMLAGSAFHLPHEQAIKAAQMHGVPLEWLARAGMLVHRPPDFAGKIQHLSLGHYFLE